MEAADTSEVRAHLAARLERAGDDGLDVYRRIVQRVDEFLKSGAPLMLEIGYAQGPAVRDLLDTTGLFAEIKIEKDQNNNDRIATARKRKEA